MCTLIVAHKVFKDFPIVIAANRDELLDRPSEPPISRDDEYGTFAPKDLARGGTWIGVNKFGVLAGITNRIDIKSKGGRKSRGDLVIEMLHHKTAFEAYGALSELSRQPFNGFNLVIADKNELFLIRGDGILMHCTLERAGVLVVTNQGIGRPGESSLPRRSENVLRVWYEGRLAELEPTLENLTPLLSIHDEGCYGTCISEPENNYGTKSSSVIRLGDNEFEYFHRDRPTTDQHVCAANFGEKMRIKINPSA